MSPEEKERRLKEHKEKRAKEEALIEKIDEAFRNNQELAEQLCKELIELTPEYCEHDRHKYSDCMACEEIEKELFPELYVKCSKCEKLFNAEELSGEGVCDDCWEADNKAVK